jgi:hypothetical protein
VLNEHLRFVPHLFPALLMIAIPMNTPASTFSGNLTLTVTFPAPNPNTLTVTALNDAFLPNATSMSVGNSGITQAGNPTTNFAGNTLTFTSGPIAGFAIGNGASASAVSFGSSQTIDLDNLTAGMLMVSLSGTYSYSLAATAGPGEAAGASFSFELDNTTNPATITVLGPVESAVVAPPNSSASCQACVLGPVALTIAPGITAINLDPFVSGEATSPEPSSLIPLACIAGALLAKRKRVQRRKTVTT